MHKTSTCSSSTCVIGVAQQPEVQMRLLLFTTGRFQPRQSGTGCRRLISDQDDHTRASTSRQPDVGHDCTGTMLVCAGHLHIGGPWSLVTTLAPSCTMLMAESVFGAMLVSVMLRLMSCDGWLMGAVVSWCGQAFAIDSAHLHHVTFQQDNARPHIARICRDFLEEEDILVLNWPPYSPDMSPSENLWDVLGRCVRHRVPVPQNIPQLLMVDTSDARADPLPAGPAGGPRVGLGRAGEIASSVRGGLRRNHTVRGESALSLVKATLLQEHDLRHVKQTQTGTIALLSWT
ncbi:hypothetical protein WMY93_015123 [Mugilogobius chulae]|uniref:Tc1-like transposase DDE domain-containing protein n=1 Tax=Mugilogobius chulae TaxID=88201 RepID=A0AAW0NXG3_9GOBI